MSRQSVCFHCAEPVPKGSHYQLTINDQQAEFCCPACLAISETIYAAGLDSYYQSRQEHAKKAQQHDFSHWDNANLQAEFVSDAGTHEHPLKQAQLYIEGMHCTACAWLIESHLGKIDAIDSAIVSYQDQQLQLCWDDSKAPLSAIMQAVNAIGYVPHPYQDDAIYVAQKKQTRQQLTRIGITALLMMQIGMLAIGIYSGDFLGMSDQQRHLLKIASLFFSLPLLYFSALPFISNAILGLRQRRINMDFNISLAISGLYGSSVYSIYSHSGDIYFDSVAMLCLFILIARFIESRSRQKLYQQQGLLPKTATKILNNEKPSHKTGTETDIQHYSEVPINDIAIGDLILIKPGQDIPLDGIIRSGHSSVSEAMINGESSACRKQCGDTVYAGSENHDGVIEVQVTAAAEQCLVNRIAELAANSSNPDAEKSISHNSVNRIASIFTTAVFTLAIATYAFWWLQGNDEAFWIALSVLVISCPCALSLAAPTALSALQYRLRQEGLLIRSAHVLPLVNKLTDIVFDKTGTLTTGQLALHKSHDYGNLNASECYAIASALERVSQHPIAKAFDDTQLLATATSIATGLGIEGLVDGQRYRIGSPAYCQQWHRGAQPPASEYMQVGLASTHGILAWFELRDNIRPEAAPLITWLHNKQLKTHILSGDSSDDVAITSKALGIDDYLQGCSSTDKLEALEVLQHQGAITMMVGDGINDAPVLQRSHVSVAFMDSSNWLQNNADIVLLSNKISKIQDLLIYAKAWQVIYRQNFTWALMYNAVAIPFAMSGWVTPMIAAIGMSISSVIVVLNSQRLLLK